jgi:hypothetical protein
VTWWRPRRTYRRWWLHGHRTRRRDHLSDAFPRRLRLARSRQAVPTARRISRSCRAGRSHGEKRPGVPRGHWRGAFLSRSSRARRVRNGAWPSRRFPARQSCPYRHPGRDCRRRRRRGCVGDKERRVLRCENPARPVDDIPGADRSHGVYRTLPRSRPHSPCLACATIRRDRTVVEAKTAGLAQALFASPRGKPDYPVEGRQKLAVSTARQAARTQSPAGRVAPKKHDEPGYAVAGLGRRAARTVAAGRCAAH